MYTERLKVLELIKEGKVTPEEGLELLAALQQPSEDSETQTDEKGEKNIHIELGVKDEDSESEIAKLIRVRVNRPNGKNVNITLPASVVRFFGGLGKTRVTVGDQDVDIDEWWEKQESGFKGVLLSKVTKSGKEVKVELL